MSRLADSIGFLPADCQLVEPDKLLRQMVEKDAEAAAKSALQTHREAKDSVAELVVSPDVMIFDIEPEILDFLVVLRIVGEVTYRCRNHCNCL